MLELDPRGREQFLAYLHVALHRTADVEKQQHLHGVVALGNHLDIEITGILRGRPDGIVQVQLVRRAFARELAQSFQRDLDVAHTQFH